MNITVLKELFDTYVKTFPQDEMIRLKIDHTTRVRQDALEIMQREQFPTYLKILGEGAALLHDVGRFKQFTQYHTFNDTKSVNHALMSCAEILRLGWLDECAPNMRNIILRAVEFHNLREVPPCLTDEEAALVHLVRDADKADIYTVLEQAMETQDLAAQPDIYWGLPFVSPISTSIVHAIETGSSVSYRDIHSFSDFILVQIAWCNGGLYFPGTCALILKRDCVKKRCHYLCSILPEHDHSTILKCCSIAETALTRKVNHGA